MTIKELTKITNNIDISEKEDLKYSEMIALTDKVITDNRKLETIFEVIYLAYKLGYKRGNANNAE